MTVSNTEEYVPLPGEDAVRAILNKIENCPTECEFFIAMEMLTCRSCQFNAVFQCHTEFHKTPKCDWCAPLVSVLEEMGDQNALPDWPNCLGSINWEEHVKESLVDWEDSSQGY